ncbi:MAG TPA: class I SAM-dependent methyltransferase [Flavisolibacter sp.]|jgi:ubiquinone/menaquinone biosynthesis C-methylase UbiE|nr:class I SAM-dependent methyltransferase [Flavisolibacter sp.]
MTETASFDSLAPGYDQAFTNTLTGREQRAKVHRYLEKVMMSKEQMHILELNCGTGTDAIWLSSWGNKVWATDLSEEMIRMADRKLSYENNQEVVFRVLSMNEIDQHFAPYSFDLIFSNFAGFNCLTPDELKLMNERVHLLLKPHGCLCTIIFGKSCLWEILYYLAKLKFGKAFRRWRRFADAELAAGINQKLTYFSVSEIIQSFTHFRLVEKRPVGLFVPPSYLEGFVQKRPGLWRRLVQWEKKHSSPTLAGLSDHTYLFFNKRT